MKKIDCSKIEKCSETKNKKLETIKDKKGGSSFFKIVNKKEKEYKIVDIENCVYKDIQGKKCDYGMIVDDKFYFIELKGSDVKKAINQILITYNDLNICIKNYKIKSRIIPTKNKIPNLKQLTEYLNLKKISEGDLLIQTKMLEKI